jgi:hypothetical protein
MKANEFVKNFGLDKTKDIINDFENGKYKDCCLDSGLINNLEKSWWDICVYDLKRLVESYELVVQCGGLEDARSHLESIRFNIATKTWFGQALLNWSMYADKLEKAIADVESCQCVEQ